MGIRGLVRNIFFIFVGAEMVRFAFFNAFDKNIIGYLGIAVIAISLWFLLEFIGIIPRA